MTRALGHPLNATIQPGRYCCTFASAEQEGV